MKSKSSPTSKINTAEALAKALIEYGCTIVLGDALKGGVVSQVYAASLKGEPIVVKHTEDLISSDPINLSVSRAGHFLDAKVLKLLENSSIRVPRVIEVFPALYTTLMEDLRSSGYTLLQQSIMKGALPATSAKKIGEALALLALESRKWKQFPTTESAQGGIYERGLELRLAYPNDQKEYILLEREFTENIKYWVWPDGHPKNMLVNEAGEVAFIDFGRSHWGDQRYMLPNFLAHIVIYAISGYLDKKQALSYIQACVRAYKKLEPIDESLFCRYLAMEVLHRANGKWIEGINKAEQKLALYKFGLHIFDESVITIEELIHTVEYD